MATPGYTDMLVRTKHFTFEYLTAGVNSVSSKTATACAIALSDNAETDFDIMNSWFDGVMPADAQIIVAFGISNPDPIGHLVEGGSAQAEAGDVNATKRVILQVNSSIETPGLMEGVVRGLRNDFVHEMSHVFAIVQRRGWTVGRSSESGAKGEALAHVMSHLLHPTGFDSMIASWLFVFDDLFHEFRHDYVTTSTPRSGYLLHGRGCGILFIYYLLSQLGFSMRGVVSSGGETLEDVYRNLTRDTNAFPKFKELVEHQFPQNGPKIFSTNKPNDQNDPFPLPTVASLSTIQYLRQNAPGTQSLRQLIASKNIGNLRALLNSDRPASLIR